MSSSDGSNEINALLAGIPQNANALGQAGAPVTLDYFGDLECPFCQQFSLEVLPSIIRRWVPTGKLRIRYRALQTATREPDVFLAQQVAALAAGNQSKAWDFVETFYAAQGEEGTGYVTEAYLDGIARQVDQLDVTRWASDRKDPKLAKEIASDAQAAAAAGLSGTPTFLLGASTGAMKVFSPSEVSSFDTAIEALAAGS
jgi:protein-disulfide isomerase